MKYSIKVSKPYRNIQYSEGEYIDKTGTKFEFNIYVSETKEEIEKHVIWLDDDAPEGEENFEIWDIEEKIIEKVKFKVHLR